MEELAKMFKDVVENISEDDSLSERIKEVSLDWTTISTMNSIEIRPVIKVNFYE